MDNINSRTEDTPSFINIKWSVLLVLSLITFFIVDLFVDFSLNDSYKVIWEPVKVIIILTIVTLLIIFLYKYHIKIRKIEDERQKLSALINAMSDFISLKDEKNRWIQLNEFGYQLYNLKEEHFSGYSDIELAEFYPDYKEHFIYCRDTDEQAWEARKPIHFEEILQLENEERTFDVVKVPIFDVYGDRKALFVIGRDVTDIKRAEELIVKNEKLSAVGQLAAGIAHEIRNPLTSLMGFVQLFQEQNDPEKQHYYDIMLSELERINYTMSELLLIAKPQKIKYKKNNLKDILENVKILMETEANMSKIKIVLNIEASLPEIHCEEYQMKQVFINIIKNAIEASKEEDCIHIHLFKKDDKHIAVTIKDEGNGIPKERLKRIGEPFFTMKEKGTGLGMTVTFKIIHAHHGQINIDSVVGVGTTVSVTLPIESDDEME